MNIKEVVAIRDFRRKFSSTHTFDIESQIIITPEIEFNAPKGLRPGPKPEEVSSYIHERWIPYLGPLLRK